MTKIKTLVRGTRVALLVCACGIFGVAVGAQQPTMPAPSAAPRAAAAATPTVPPEPDLGKLEPAVAKQLGAARTELVAMLARAEADAAARAAAWGKAAQLYHAYSLLDAAAVCYRQAAALAPAELRWPYLLGLVERGRADATAARAAFEAALARGAYPPAWVGLAEIALAEGNAEEARAAAERALTLAPADPGALAVLGQAYLSQRDYAAAVTVLEQALTLLPQADRLHYPLGLAYRGLGNAARAEEHLARAGRTGARPNDPLLEEVEAERQGELAPLLRGRKAAAAGDWRAAAAEFRRAVAANAESVAAHVDLGAALLALGDLAGGRAELEAALRRAPANFTAHFNLGVLDFRAGNMAAALPHLEAAVASRPADAEARRTLGETLIALGRPAEAVAHLRAAVEAAPADESARFGEAVALVRSGDVALARTRLEEALRQMPEQGRLAELLARLLAAAPDLSLRDGARAVDLATRVWQAQPTDDHARTLALALAEAGRCSEAAALVRSLGPRAAPVEQSSLEAMAREWEAGPPCRPRAQSPVTGATPAPPSR